MCVLLPLFFQVDKDFIPGLMYIRDMEASASEVETMAMPFAVPSASGQDVPLSSRHSHITLDNRDEFVRLAINYRFVLLRSMCLTFILSVEVSLVSWNICLLFPLLLWSAEKLFSHGIPQRSVFANVHS